MKGMYLGRRFYRQMFGLVLLIPVVMHTALLYPLPPQFAVSLLFSVFYL